MNPPQKLFEIELEFDASVLPKKNLGKPQNGNLTVDQNQTRIFIETLIDGTVHELRLGRLKGNVFTGSLIVKADPSDLPTIRNQLHSLYKSDKEYSEIAACEDKDIEPILKEFSGSALEVFKHGTPLRTVRHQSGREFVTADLTPYYLRDSSGTKVLIVAQTAINFLAKSTSPEKSLGAVSLFCQLKDKKTSNTPTAKIFGIDAASDAQYSQMETKGIQADVKVGLDGGLPTVTPSVGVSYSETKKQLIKLLRPIEIREDDNYIGVQFLISKELKEQFRVASLVQAFYFRFPNADIKLEDLQVTSDILLRYDKLLSTSTRTVTCTFDLSKISTNPKSVVIGGLMGVPKCGKTSFIDAVFSLTKGEYNGIRIDNTACLRAHSFHFDQKKPSNQNGSEYTFVPKAFTFLDTRGYCFDPTNPHDQQLLAMFISGLAENTDFSKTKLPTDSETDIRHGLTHIILTAHARDIYGGRIKWTEQYEGIQSLVRLYNLAAEHLAHFRFNGNKDRAKDNVYVLVTHVDMLSDDPATKAEARTWMDDELKNAHIPPNKIIFGEKTCSWDETDLRQHENKVNTFLTSIPPHEDYQDHMQARGLPPFFFRISDKYCAQMKKPGGCKHVYTAETTTEFQKLLNIMLSD